jgi:hypothetical protein
MNSRPRLNGKFGVPLGGAGVVRAASRPHKLLHNSEKRAESCENVVVEPLGGVAGRARVMRAIAQSMPSHARPRLIFFANGEYKLD